jgi:N-methylhydantoinase B
VLAEELDDDDAATTDAARASRPAPVEVLFDRGGGYARLPGGVSYTDVDVVGS